jgi:hypothetical protein
MRNVEVRATEPIEIVIDRIVDGGMSPADLRAAIQQVESARDGWRRCALAFLEAQSWGETLKAMGEHHAEERCETQIAERESGFASAAFLAGGHKREPHVGWIRQSLAAAVVALVFSLGWLGHSLRLSGSGALPLESSQTNPMTLRHVASEKQVVANSMEHPQSIAADQPVFNRVPLIREIGRLHVGSTSEGTVEIPILDGPGVDPRAVLEQPAPISEHRRALWRRQGYEFEQRRQLIAVPLADGRRAAVPVDQVRVRFVGRDPL